MELNVKITPQQNQILRGIEGYKFIVITKGRRFGFTHGMMIFCFMWMLEKKVQILWGDTINGNIDRYLQRYMLPMLKTLPENSWLWNAQKRELRVMNSTTLDPRSELASIMDFRSSDQPENWEGFGYSKIILNEAGIILKNSYLYKNAVLPMMLDFPDSQCIMGGVAKGRTIKNGEEHPFYTVAKKCTEGSKTHKRFNFTSYDSAVASKEDIDQLIEELGGHNHPIVRQEIYGEFIDAVDLPFLHAFSRDVNIGECKFNPYQNVYFCFDFNVKSTCLVIQFDEKGIKVLEEYHDDLDSICFNIKNKYGTVNCYINGDASGNNDNASNETYYEIVRNNLDISFEFNFRVPKSNPRHKASYNQCNYIFKHYQVLINPSCKQLIRDCEMVQIIQKNGKIEIDKSDQTLTHHIDPLRYHINAEHLDKISVNFDE